MTEFKKAVAKYKSDLNACYGIAVQQRVYGDTDTIKNRAARRGPGRPISTGIGKKVTIYLPNKSLDLLDRISRDWSGSRSDIIQEAIARYAADLDAVIQEGEAHDIAADHK